MTDTTPSSPAAAPELPDRLSTDPGSPFFNEPLIERGIGVRFKGVEKTNVVEYCLSEGWVRLAVGNSVDRKGRPLTMKVQGAIEVYIRGAETA